MLDHVARRVCWHDEARGRSGTKQHSAIRVENIAELQELWPGKQTRFCPTIGRPHAFASVLPSIPFEFLPDAHVGPGQVDRGMPVKLRQHGGEKLRLPPIVIFEERLIGFAGRRMREIESLDRSDEVVGSTEREARIAELVGVSPSLVSWGSSRSETILSSNPFLEASAN